MLDGEPFLPEGIEPVRPDDLNEVQVPSKDGPVIRLIVSDTKSICNV